MPSFLGSLNANEIYATLYNMIISQQVFADNFSHNYNLVDEARVDGSLYGDTKLYYAVDVLKTKPWGADSEASNLLTLARPSDPDTQAITLNVFRQISLTIDNYLSKRAWMDEGSFGSFTAVMLQQMNETKRVYENTLYNTYIGNVASATGNQTITINYELPSGVTLGTEEANRLVGAKLAMEIANIIDDVKDYSRAYNDYGNLRSYAEGDLKFVWNTKFLNQIRYMDTPTVFHDEDLRKHLFDRKLPARYFGTGITTTTSASSEGDRIAEEMEFSSVDYFAGDLLPTGTGNTVSKKIYVNDDTIACKIFVKLPPFMSAFVVGTSFFNAKSLTENRYLTFGHNSLEYLKNYPVITVKLNVSEATVDDGGDGGEE